MPVLRREHRAIARDGVNRGRGACLQLLERAFFGERDRPGFGRGGGAIAGRYPQHLFDVPRRVVVGEDRAAQFTGCARGAQVVGRTEDRVRRIPAALDSVSISVDAESRPRRGKKLHRAPRAGTVDRARSVHDGSGSRPWSHSTLPMAASTAQSIPYLRGGLPVQRQIGSRDFPERKRGGVLLFGTRRWWPTPGEAVPPSAPASASSNEEPSRRKTQRRGGGHEGVRTPAAEPLAGFQPGQPRGHGRPIPSWRLRPASTSRMSRMTSDSG